MLDFNPNKEERMKWWNVVLLMNDGTIKLSYARGEDLEGAKRWFDKATYISARNNYKKILDFNPNFSNTYNEFVEKENALKAKYNL